SSASPWTPVSTRTPPARSSPTPRRTPPRSARTSARPRSSAPAGCRSSSSTAPTASPAPSPSRCSAARWPRPGATAPRCAASSATTRTPPPAARTGAKFRSAERGPHVTAAGADPVRAGRAARIRGASRRRREIGDDGEIRTPHSGRMETFENLVRAEFTPKNTYLNTASNALLPARTVTALAEAARMRAEGRSLDPLYDDVEASRAAFARLAGVPAERVAVGSTAALYTALV